MTSKIMKIDLSRYGGPVYSGRSRGEYLRSKLELDSIDEAQDTVVEVSIPDNTYSVTSSFFLGLFGPSIVNARSADNFYSKFQIHAQPVIIERISSFVDRALQRKTLFN